MSAKDLLNRSQKAMKAGAHTALNMIMPPQCPASGEPVAAPGHLSAAGWRDLHFIDDPVCPGCGAPFSVDYGDDIKCGSCLAEPPDFDRARAAISYDDASHRMVVSFKHSDRTDMAPMFARWMVRAGAPLMTDDHIVIPTPLHPRRLLARRFNQSALLAQGIAKLANSRLSIDALKRVRPTPPQQSLSGDARRRNVRGAFQVAPENADLINGAAILLIDDVLTTGATLSSAARALKQAGASRVDALVLARVVKGGQVAI